MQVKVLRFRSYEKNTLRGFADFEIEKLGLEIKDCTYHTKGRDSWIGFPAREYTNKDGEKKWMNLVYFSNKTYGEKFQQAALLALANYIADEEF